jgi:hypothetical protein
VRSSPLDGSPATRYAGRSSLPCVLSLASGADLSDARAGADAGRTDVLGRPSSSKLPFIFVFLYLFHSFE